MELAAVVVVALLSSPAAPGRVPPLPAGHRVQYSLQHADGSFKYGWDTGSGQVAQVEGDARNEVQGSYSGGPVSVHYTAGVGGYVPNIGEVPVGQDSVQSHIGPEPGLVLPGRGSSHGASGQSGWSSSWSSGAPAAPAAPAAPVGPIRPDGSYSFSYNSGDHSHQASADAANNVRGTFSFKAPDDGHTRTVNYHAGAATGFVAQGAHLPTPPPVPGPGGVQQVVGSAWSGAQDEGPSSGPSSGPSRDASYSFGYQSSDSNRQESSDPSGNIHGSYSFVAPDGQRRRVDYEAGAGKGFIAKGDFLPKEGATGVQSSWQSGGHAQSSWQSGGHAQSSWQPGGHAQSSWQPGGDVQTTWQPNEDVQTTWQPNGDEQQHIGGGGGGVQRPQGGAPAGGAANTQSSQHGDGSYSFSYSTNDQSRHEQGDAQGNVKGSFSFVAKDDGKNRRVDYHAGAGTGFVAKGDHLPSAPTESQQRGQQQPHRRPHPQHSPLAHPQPPTPSNDEQQTIQLDAKIDLRVDDGSQQRIDDSQQKIDGNQQKIDGSQQKIDLGDEGSGEGSGAGSGDASYQFAYQNKDSSRHEKSDAKGNVQGSFSFVAPDGVERRVDYEAGAGKGFVAKGDHLPKEGDTGAGAEQQTQLPWDEGQTSLPVGGGLADDDQQTQQPWSDEQQTQGPDGDSGSGDASYSYSYQTDTSSKQETSDPAGNVQGSFSYIDASGEKKTVTYTARHGEGFEARGDHLPKVGHFPAPPPGGDQHGGPNSWSRGRQPQPQRHGLGLGQPGVKSSWRSEPVPVPVPVPVHPSASIAPHGGQGVVRTYLPPGVKGHKVGYVYEEKSR